MLTKEHLKFKVRNGRVKPELLPEDDEPTLAAAAEMLGIFQNAVGQSFGELEEAATALAGGPTALAFKKLLLDQCDVDAEDEGLVERRWEWLKAAQALRSDGKPTIGLFHERLAKVAALGIEQVKSGLYGDLPACRTVRGVRDMSPAELLRRYNCGQVQGLLLRSRRVTLRVKDASLGERRELFRQVKFRRLIAAVQEDGDKGLLLELSGPLGLLDQASAYGLRLAAFFPSVLHLKAWELRAEVHINSKELELRLDQSLPLRSHYQKRDPYIPEELTAFVEAFNQREAGRWRAEAGGDFVHIGRESYCFPDLTIHGQGRRIGVELFHRWHAGQLVKRLDVLDNCLETAPISDLLVGVGKVLAAGPAKERLAESRWFRKFGFIFSDFPTPKIVAARLEGKVQDERGS